MNGTKNVSMIRWIGTATLLLVLGAVAVVMIDSGRDAGAQGAEAGRYALSSPQLDVCWVLDTATGTAYFVEVTRQDGYVKTVYPLPEERAMGRRPRSEALR